MKQSQSSISESYGDSRELADNILDYGHRPSACLRQLSTQGYSPYAVMAQILEQIRSILIANLGYELKTPLSTIQVTLETVAEVEAVPIVTQKQMLATAWADLQQVCSSIQSFLEFSNQLWCSALNSLLDSRGEENRETYFPICSETQESNLKQFQFLEQAQSTLVAIVNHELRTPLATIRVCLESLQDEPILDRAIRQEFVDVALLDLDRLRLLIGDLLLLSRLQSGQVYFQIEPVDLKVRLEALLNSIFQQRQEQNLPRISFESTSPDTKVWVDGDRLVEVVTRLLDNAYRFTPPEGEVKVNIWISDQGTQILPSGHFSNESTLKICVSDTGKGIATEELANIFNCFYQEENFLQRTVGGVGVGLTICNYLIQGMGGEIWAESPGKDQGSQFCFTLPVHRQL